jgi:hypothetical protein
METERQRAGAKIVEDLRNKHTTEPLTQAPPPKKTTSKAEPRDEVMSYPIFMPKPSTHCMHDLGSIVPHIRPKVFTDNQMSRIKYDYYNINSVSKDYDDSQWNGTAEDSITPQE